MNPFNARAEIQPDGTFVGDIVVPDSAAPGPTAMIATCYDLAMSELKISPTVTLTVETPFQASIAPTVVAPGDPITFHAECGGQAPYNWVEVRFVSDDGTSFMLQGGFDGATLALPSSTRWGTYTATATCEEERGQRPTKYFQPVSVTVVG